MLWFTPKCFLPKSSEVADTAMDVTEPVHAPMIAVERYKKIVVELRSKKKDPAIGAMSIAIDKDLDTLYLALRK